MFNNNSNVLPLCFDDFRLPNFSDDFRPFPMTSDFRTIVPQRNQSEGSQTIHLICMTVGTKLTPNAAEEEVLTEYIPKHVRLCGLHFGRFICNCLNCYFTKSRLYLHLNYFLNLFFPVHIISRCVQFGSVIRKVKYLKLKTPR